MFEALIKNPFEGIAVPVAGEKIRTAVSRNL
jgi:hypothetical protein